MRYEAIESYTLRTRNASYSWDCGSCGVVISDRRRHDAFHRTIRLMPGYDIALARTREWSRITGERAS